MRKKRKRNKKKKAFIFILLAMVLAIALGGGVLTIKRKKEVKKKAEAEKAMVEIEWQASDGASVLAFAPKQQTLGAFTLSLSFASEVKEVIPFQAKILKEEIQGKTVSVTGYLPSPHFEGGKVLLFKVNTEERGGEVRLIGGEGVFCHQEGDACKEDSFVRRSFALLSSSAAASETSSLFVFKIRFSGVEEKIPDQKVTLKFIKGGEKKVFPNVVVKSDEKGVLTGELTLKEVVPGEGYTVVIKGPRHLAGRFCVDGQTQRCSSEGKITISSGENRYDFSGYSLLPGDIPDETGKQDGVVDVKDFYRLKRALTSSDEKLKENSDLDFNGVVSGRDVVLFLQTLAERYYDEDN
ncbi:hypothetical protein J7J95_02010 [bacterium]|nr:hypothetical protein [bacterium]